MSEWRLIETAPKDGTEVLLFGLNWRRPIIGRWIDSEDFQYGKSVNKRQYWNIGWHGWSRDHDPEPTHWMPLPANPEDL